MKKLLVSIVAATALAGAATLVIGLDSAAGFLTAMPRGSQEIEINRAAKADRLRAGSTVLVRAIRIPRIGERREARPVTIPIDCEALVSPLADVVARQQPRQCTT